MVVAGGKEGGWESCGEGGGEGEGASAPGLRQVPITRRLLKNPRFFCHGAGAPLKFLIWEITFPE